MLKLTFREKEVYSLIVLENLRDKEIAERLCITEDTAEAHIHNILKKKCIKDCRDLIFDYYKEQLNEKKEHRKIVRFVDNM